MACRLPDGLTNLLEVLPVLRTGEAIIMGEAAKLPMRCRIALPSAEHQPRSSDPKVSRQWSLRRRVEGYDRVTASWRAQRPRAVVRDVHIVRQEVTGEPDDGMELDMERHIVSSSNIASIGYDQGTETLEVEFINGSVYQYYNVGQMIYDQMMEAPSKGRFLNMYIRNSYPYSRV